MPDIVLLTKETIDKIAAGEVVDRPSSVVKELVENAIDAKATAITIEIKEGGCSFIRITDNGCGIKKEQIKIAFLRHSTSKIRSVEDLLCVSSLGFRGEALSSISAVARVELITKTKEELTGTRYVIEGSKEIAFEEVGAPEGTTFLVRDLFYNTPARKKFLKSATTEASYISDLVEKLALSHPEVSFKFINNNQTKLHTSGNGNRKDLVYQIYGREIAKSLVEVEYEGENFSVEGYIGKPVITRGNRNYENYFINGRYIKSNLLSRAIEEGYKNYLMQHQYPFTVLYFKFPAEQLDVNVHPSKMELRFGNNELVYRDLCAFIELVLSGRNLIPEVPVVETKEEEHPVKTVSYEKTIPEPFEAKRLNAVREAVAKDSPYQVQYTEHVSATQAQTQGIYKKEKSAYAGFFEKIAQKDEEIKENESVATEMTLADFSQEFRKEIKKASRIIGQVFDTYWLLEYEDKLYIVDQHAAHEKVLFERTMARLKEKEFTTQMVSPPMIISLDAHEEEMLLKYEEPIRKLGYVVEPFGGREYQICGVPDNLFHIDMKDLFVEMLDDFANLSGRQTPELILEKIASMSCKAAVKGNNRLSLQEVQALMDELLTLENPFNCPHGRPTIISMTKYELEKKFKRIV